MQTKRVTIVLVPGFSHLSLGAVLEPLHTLNTIASDIEIIIDIATISEPDIASASGLRVYCPVSLQACHESLTSTKKPDALFLCCGLKTPYKSQPDLRKLVRSCVRSGVPLYGLGCSTWKMADAGVLQNGRGTVHWKTLAAFSERNRDIEALDALFVTSDNVTSCAGEAAALDLAVSFLQSEFTPKLAEQVCNHLLISFPRSGDLKQPRGNADRLRDVPDTLRNAVSLMSENLEDPLTVGAVAKSIGISLRQTERLFSTHLSMAPKRYYLKLRLQHARQLIEQTSLSILEISVASGFASRRVFTRYYRNEFGYPPSHTRRSP
jgi:transcriptional regulator GlxA family with amidase domain